MSSSNDSGQNSYETSEWIISSVNSTILSSQDYERWHEELDLKALPEMVFGYNKLILKNKKNQFTYQFNPYDSLKLVSKDEPPFKVVHSTKWTKSNEDQLKELSNPTVLYDWTFETKYQGTIESSQETYEIIDEIDNPEEQGIPYELLKRNEPILKYFEVHLFEDELHDNGISELIVRCRIMKDYWYCLLRFWLRVDNVIFRLIDTRLFYMNGSSVIVKEFSIKEGQWNEVNSALKGDFKLLNNPNLVGEYLKLKEKKVSHIKLK